MPNAPPTNVVPRLAHAPEQELVLLTDHVIRMVVVARALVRHRRPVDLNGLQEPVGLLCAKALDLPPDRTGLVRMELLRLRDALDELHDAMRESAA